MATMAMSSCMSVVKLDRHLDIDIPVFVVVVAEGRTLATRWGLCSLSLLCFIFIITYRRVEYIVCGMSMSGHACAYCGIIIMCVCVACMCMCVALL